MIPITAMAASRTAIITSIIVKPLSRRCLPGAACIGAPRGWIDENAILATARRGTDVHRHAQVGGAADCRAVGLERDRVAQRGIERVRLADRRHRTVDGLVDRDAG